MSGRKSGLRSRIIGRPCIFCGGETVSTTIEHAPPIAMFDKRNRPKGFEFPACMDCNRDTSKFDQVASMFISLSADAITGLDTNNSTHKLMKGVANNFPEVLSYLNDDGRSPEEITSNNQDGSYDLLIVPVNRQLFRKWLNPWLAKQGAALWYHETGKVVGFNDRVSVRWLDPKVILQKGLPGEILESLSNVGMMSNGNKELSRLFSYRYAISNDSSFGAFLILFRDSVLGFCSIASRETIVKYYDSMSLGELYAPRKGFGLQRCIELPLASV